MIKKDQNMHRGMASRRYGHDRIVQGVSMFCVNAQWVDRKVCGSALCDAHLL